ncbi:hypothetical protein [Bacillus cereus]|uniref:Uncharacterized protein n=1 Tax=Bacillus cereus TaxID=1396 RepID=A0A164KF36_BACCE|nr:hypothetical protein [Bacillus cereus]KZD50169.1 hypothetical protein B4088_6366 [Bacillus cereus]
MTSLFKAAVNKLSGMTALKTFGGKLDYFSKIMKYENRKMFDAAMLSFVSMSKEDNFINLIDHYMFDNFINSKDIEMNETIQLFTKEKQLPEWIRSIHRDAAVGNTENLWYLRSKSVYVHAKFALDNLGSDTLEKEIESNEVLWQEQAEEILIEMESLIKNEDFYNKEAEYQKQKGLKVLRKIASEGDFNVYALVYECRDLVAKQDVENNIKNLKQELKSATSARNDILKQLDEETDEAVIAELDEMFARQTDRIRDIKRDIASGGQNKGFMTLIKQPVQTAPKTPSVQQQVVKHEQNDDANMQSLLHLAEKEEPFTSDQNEGTLVNPF